MTDVLDFYIKSCFLKTLYKKSYEALIQWTIVINFSSETGSY